MPPLTICALVCILLNFRIDLAIVSFSTKITGVGARMTVQVSITPNGRMSLPADIRKRLADSGRKDWGGRSVEFSYQVVGESALPHNLKELECDLLGNYYETFRKAPVFQYRSAGD